MSQDVFAAVEDAIVAAATASLAEGFAISPQVHLVLDGDYAGYISTRPYRRGKDAAAAIADLGLLPAGLYASEITVAWDDADLRASLGAPGGYPDGLAVVRATFTEHSMTWCPYESVVGPPTARGIPSIRADWGARSTHDRAPLAEPIQSLLDTWRALSAPPVETVIGGLQAAGYQLHFVDQASDR